MENDKVLEELFAERKRITDKINQHMKQKSNKYLENGKMSEVVKDDNPYSRLMALKRMGVVKNYEVLLLIIHRKSKNSRF